MATGSDDESSEKHPEGPAEESEDSSSLESSQEVVVPKRTPVIQPPTRPPVEDDDEDEEEEDEDVPSVHIQETKAFQGQDPDLSAREQSPSPRVREQSPSPRATASQASGSHGSPSPPRSPAPPAAPSLPRAPRSSGRPSPVPPRSSSSSAPRPSRKVPSAPKQRARSAGPTQRKPPTPVPDDLLVVRRGRPAAQLKAHYLLATEAEKMRAKARSQPLHLREAPPSPVHPAPPRGPPRKAPKAADAGPPPPPDFQYCLGKKLSDIREQPSAAFASHTPRMSWHIPDVPAPGYCVKLGTPTPKQKAFPEIKDADDRGKLVTGFGSTTRRDMTFSLTNGCLRDPSPRKGVANPRPPSPTKMPGPNTRPRPNARPSPAPSPTWQTMPLYSSFSPSPLRPAERAKCSSSWALSKVGRDPYEMERLQKELKERQARPKEQKLPKPPPKQQKLTEKDWVELARKQVERRPERRDPSKAAFGSSGPRHCLAFGKPATAPAPGDYVIP